VEEKWHLDGHIYIVERGLIDGVKKLREGGENGGKRRQERATLPCASPWYMTKFGRDIYPTRERLGWKERKIAGV
jgi:hypothetical protein